MSFAWYPQIGCITKIKIVPQCQPLSASPLIQTHTLSANLSSIPHENLYIQDAPSHEGNAHSPFSLLIILCSSLSLHPSLVSCPTSNFTVL